MLRKYCFALELRGVTILIFTFQKKTFYMLNISLVYLHNISTIYIKGFRLATISQEYLGYLKDISDISGITLRYILLNLAISVRLVRCGHQYILLISLVHTDLFRISLRYCNIPARYRNDILQISFCWVWINNKTQTTFRLTIRVLFSAYFFKLM